MFVRVCICMEKSKHLMHISCYLYYEKVKNASQTNYISTHKRQTKVNTRIYIVIHNSKEARANGKFCKVYACACVLRLKCERGNGRKKKKKKRKAKKR